MTTTKAASWVKGLTSLTTPNLCLTYKNAQGKLDVPACTQKEAIDQKCVRRAQLNNNSDSVHVDQQQELRQHNIQPRVLLPLLHLL